jgi:putative proteasome-type protease
VSILDERSKAPEHRQPSIFELPTMFGVAQLVGEILRDTIQRNSDTGERSDSSFNATLLVGGQIAGMEPRLFLVYPEGNFIEASEDTPFLQIGETKYGRPILLRAYDPAMTFEEAVKLLVVSFDSTMKANLSVGMPLDISLYNKDSFKPQPMIRIESDDPYYQSISTGWGDALKSAIDSLPNPTL